MARLGRDQEQDEALSRARRIRIYEEVQTLQREEQPATVDEMQVLADNWQHGAIPALQRRVADYQLQNLKQGIVDPVFSSLAEALQAIPLPHFTLLDAACASGYFYEVIRVLDPRPIQYAGCDYSRAMVQAAQQHYPDVEFQVQDLTALSYPDSSFDVVMASGVLEHIPHYETAIAHLCRIARRYIIHHRCPLTSASQHEYTIGSQYNIETPRIFFAKALLRQEFLKWGFQAIKEIDVYPHQRGGTPRIKTFVKRLLGRPAPATRVTHTFVFERMSV